MENYKYLRENRAFDVNLKSNLLKESKLNVLKTNNTKLFLINEIQKQNVTQNQNKKQNEVETQKEIEEVDLDVSMLSINEDNVSCQYHLPSSAELKNENVIRKFTSDIIARRNLNRELQLNTLSNYSQDIKKISKDIDTGDIFILELLDYIQEIESLLLPLGMDFLYNSPINVKLRSEGINWMYQICHDLDVDRYSVAGGVVIFDRYLMMKGNELNGKSYTSVIVSCWYLACKWDLLEYPAIKDVCTYSNIKSIDKLREMEHDILDTIDFSMGVPIPIHFLRTMSILKQRDQGVSHKIAKCLTEVCQMNYELAAHPVHIIAAASYCLSMKMSMHLPTVDDAWLPIIQFVIGLSIDDIRPVIAKLARFLVTANFKMDMPYIHAQYKDFFVRVEQRIPELQAVANYQ